MHVECPCTEGAETAACSRGSRDANADWPLSIVSLRPSPQRIGVATGLELEAGHGKKIPSEEVDHVSRQPNESSSGSPGPAPAPGFLVVCTVPIRVLRQGTGEGRTTALADGGGVAGGTHDAT